MSFITQDWTQEEAEQIESIGFKLNNRNYYIKNTITLTKRLDGEFNELYYQAYNSNGLIGNFAANHVENAFEQLAEIAQMATSEDVFNLASLIRIYSEKGYHIEMVPENNENFDYSATLILNGVSQGFDADTESELELKLLYHVLNDLKSIIQ